MTWEVAVAGTVTRDDVTTPHGRRRDQAGGSAVYSALAAARHARVHLAGVVGRDWEDTVRGLLAGAGVGLAGLSVADQPTFRWRAVHDFRRWKTASESSEEGACSTWDPRPSAAWQRAAVLFVGSLRPALQTRVRELSSARLVGIDSMSSFIAAEGDGFRRLLSAVDILFLDRTELARLTDRPPRDWRRSARGLCGRGRLRAVVVKAGPAGAACVTSRSVIELPAAPVPRVIDPTGAGDALAGGFLGACARAQRNDGGFWAEALREGLRCAADAVSQFGLAGLTRGGLATPG